jgi:hypothetical protein
MVGLFDTRRDCDETIATSEPFLVEDEDFNGRDIQLSVLANTPVCLKVDLIVAFHDEGL